MGLMVKWLRGSTRLVTRLLVVPGLAASLSALAQAGGLLAIDKDWQQGAMVKGRVEPGTAVACGG